MCTKHGYIIKSLRPKKVHVMGWLRKVGNKKVWGEIFEIVFVGYLENGTTFTDVYYASVLGKMRTELNEKVHD